MPRDALVVEDDNVTRLVLCHMLRRRGWTVDEAPDAPAAISRIAEKPYDLVVSDYLMPSGNGIDVLDAVEGSGTATSFILVTGVIEHSSVSSALASRLSAHLSKPVSSADLAGALDRLPPPTDS